MSFSALGRVLRPGPGVSSLAMIALTKPLFARYSITGYLTESPF